MKLNKMLETKHVAGSDRHCVILEILRATHRQGLYPVAVSNHSHWGSFALSATFLIEHARAGELFEFWNHLALGYAGESYIRPTFQDTSPTHYVYISGLLSTDDLEPPYVRAIDIVSRECQANILHFTMSTSLCDVEDAELELQMSVQCDDWVIGARLETKLETWGKEEAFEVDITRLGDAWRRPAA